MHVSIPAYITYIKIMEAVQRICECKDELGLEYSFTVLYFSSCLLLWIEVNLLEILHYSLDTLIFFLNA